MVLTNPQLETLLQDIVRRLCDALRPQRIYLLGSYAYGNPTADSDVDLVVVVAHSDLNWYRRGAVAYRALRGIGVPVDVQVFTREEFEKRASLPISFEKTVCEKGRLLYAA
jgi:predicted nucleotidyltransferase